ncbi:molybdopterin-dependent oxidoreductase [Algoriphagus sp.]|uniref:molybdopterin-dependent oxidoreductase n=1 Tax=Algoriphagus sp. TaxID=1872435 RepID=UPI00391A7C84
MNTIVKKISFLCLILLAVVRFGHAQESRSIQVIGEVMKPLRLSLEDLGKMNVQEVTVKDRDDQSRIYKGVVLVDLLQEAGVTLGKDLRGENLTKYLIMRAADGYEVIYSLAEVDPEFTDNIVLLAFEMDGKPLPTGEGPFRIVASGDKRPARWIRELRVIKVAFAQD